MSLIFQTLRRHWRAMAAGMAALLLCDGLQLVVPQVVRGVFNDIQLKMSGANTGAITSVTFAVAGLKFAGLTLAVALTRMLWRMIVWPRGRRMEYEIRRDFFAHLQTLPPDFFQSSTTGDLLSRASSDLDTVRRFFAMGLLSFADPLLLIPVSLVMLSSMDWRLAVAAAVPLFAGVPLSKVLLHRLHATYRASQDTLGELTGRVEEDIAGVRTLKSYAREGAARARFERLNADYTAKAVRVALLNSLFEPYFRLIPHIAVMAVLLWGGIMVMDGRLRLGDLAACLLYVDLMIWPTFAIGMGLNMLQRARASAQRIEEILRQPPAERAAEAAGPERVEGRLVFRRLTFTHKDRTEPVLKDFSLEVPCGMVLGITGPTGSGKSTLLTIAAGLLTPPRGTVLIDGVDLRDFGLPKLRRAITLVEQTPFLFSRSIAENLTYGRADAPPELVGNAVNIAALDQEVARFEDGLATIVGERGVTLSGGQRLRAALARALIMGPPVVLLDDVFSAVDVGTEKRIWSGIRPWCKGHTVLIVSHRISVLRACDRVAVVEDGRLAEYGTHQELLRGGGFYAATFALQERFET